MKLWLRIVSCHENFCGFGSNCQNLKTILEAINSKPENVRKNAETIDLTLEENVSVSINSLIPSLKETFIQIPTFAYLRLLNKPYKN